MRRIQYDYRELFNSDLGRRVLNDLKKKCPLLRDGISTANGVDTNKALVMLGEHRVLMHIFKMLDKDPRDIKESNDASRD